MKQSVVGMFEERADALAARNAIVAAGIADVDVNLLPADEVGPTGLTDAEFARYTEAIRFLFQTGADDEAELYIDALRRGATLLTAITEDERHLDELRAILQRHNARNAAEDRSRRGRPTAAEVAAEKAKG